MKKRYIGLSAVILLAVLIVILVLGTRGYSLKLSEKEYSFPVGLYYDTNVPGEYRIAVPINPDGWETLIYGEFTLTE